MAAQPEAEEAPLLSPPEAGCAGGPPPAAGSPPAGVGQVRKGGPLCLAAACGAALAVLLWRCSSAAAPRPREALETQATERFQLMRPAHCPCGWITKDNCQNVDPCACYCRSIHPEGRCTACSSQLFLDAEGHDGPGQPPLASLVLMTTPRPTPAPTVPPTTRPSTAVVLAAQTTAAGSATVRAGGSPSTTVADSARASTVATVAAATTVRPAAPQGSPPALPANDSRKPFPREVSNLVSATVPPALEDSMARPTPPASVTQPLGTAPPSWEGPSDPVPPDQVRTGPLVGPHWKAPLGVEKMISADHSQGIVSQKGAPPFIGANLGGWLVAEDWIWGPEMMDKKIHDEWGLVKHHGGPGSSAAIKIMRTHWDTFVSEQDLDHLLDFGVTHVRIPVGYWLADYKVADGFVEGGVDFLNRVVTWLKRRGMQALVELHALPCAQVAGVSFTGRRVSKGAPFFTNRACYERGQRSIIKLAKLLRSYDDNQQTCGVIMGMGLLNEPDWSFWNTSPGIKELYRTMVPAVRRILPPNRYSLHLSFADMPREYGAMWLATMQDMEPKDFANVVYDVHLFHSLGDDNAPGMKWNADVDACKTCCRDPQIMAPLVIANLTILIAEYSLNTGFPGNDGFWKEHMRRQLSLWRNTPGVIGSFFWTHRILLGKSGWFRELSLLDLIEPKGPLPRIEDLDVDSFCPAHNLTRCPHYDIRYVTRTEPCVWKD